MHTQNPFGHRKNHSSRERRLVWDTAPGENPEEQPEAAPENPQSAVEGIQNETRGADATRQVLDQAADQPSTRDAARRRPNTGERRETAERTSTAPETQRRRERTVTPPAQPAQTAQPQASDRLPAHGLGLSKKPESAIVNTGVTAGVIGGSVAAGMNAARLANVPVLGKFASVVSGGLSTASNAISGLLTQVGAPSQLSVLAHPVTIGVATPMLGLWMLGKYRMHTLKNFYLANPQHKNAQETLSRIQQIENTKNIFARNWYPVREGMKLVAGTVRLPFRAIPEMLGAATGRIAGSVSKIGKKLGGLKGMIEWPFKNIKHLTVGGAGGGAAAGIGTYALGHALAAGSGASVLGPWAVPIAAAAGAIYGYRLSKRKKHGGAAALASAES